MAIVGHRPHAIRDQIVDREVRRLELIQRAKREGTARPPRSEAPGMPPGPR
jgi:hypothetical protein